MTISIKSMDKAKVTVLWSNIMYDDELLETLYSWHGGQTDPIYAVASSLGAGRPENLTKSIVNDAIYNLKLTLKQIKGKHYKGYSRADIVNLKYIITTLEDVYNKMPDDGSEDLEDFLARR